MSSTVDPYGILGLTRKPDGSISRIPNFLPSTSASSDPHNSVLTKDILINQEKETWVRLYLPRPDPDAINPFPKLPLIVYYHGGAFAICGPDSKSFQKFCSNLVSEFPAVIVSVKYRLSPEHRLPAAYDDSIEALRWIGTSGDEWLTKYADFTNCFLMGSSAGGNIAYHVGLRAAEGGGDDDVSPLRIRGMILHQPFFGGVQRSSSEIRFANDKVLPNIVSDLAWELALPIGVDRDHEYCNPTVNIRSEALGKIKDQGWKVLVTGYEGDPLVDRQIEIVKILEENGVGVIGKFSDGGCHGYEFMNDSSAKIFYDVVKNFVEDVFK